jgi:cysteine desulfurase
MPERVYLDWNATAPMRPEARAACVEALGLAGNPSSVHAEGRAARRVVEAARAKVAALVRAEPSNVIFTSGGTEANMLALTPMIEDGTSKQHRDLLLLSAIEHPSVSHGGRFPRHQTGEIPVTSAGVIDLDMLRRMLKPGAHALVSVMLANNETGVLQPIREAAEIVHEAGGLLHVDAVQGPGRIAVDLKALGADLLTLSAHKLGGPKGAGALILREGLHIADPLIRGGGQERGTRAGTENVAAIAGFGAAAEAAAAAMDRDAAQMESLRSQLETGLKARTPEAVIFGAETARLPNTTLFAVPGLKAETAVIAFDLEGVAVSSGAACSSGKVQPSHVLAAMGVDQALARGAVRVSLGPTTAETEVGSFLKAWNRLSESLGKERRGLAA